MIGSASLGRTRAWRRCGLPSEGFGVLMKPRENEPIGKTKLNQVRLPSPTPWTRVSRGQDEQCNKQGICIFPEVVVGDRNRPPGGSRSWCCLVVRGRTTRAGQALSVLLPASRDRLRARADPPIG